MLIHLRKNSWVSFSNTLGFFSIILYLFDQLSARVCMKCARHWAIMNDSLNFFIEFLCNFTKPLRTCYFLLIFKDLRTMLLCFPPDVPPVFLADRPFVYSIYDKNTKCSILSGSFKQSK